MAQEVADAADRVREYLRQYDMGTGRDPEVITVVHIDLNGKRAPLLVSDLTTLVDAVTPSPIVMSTTVEQDAPPPSDEVTEGWAWPDNARKAHYYVDHRSLCGKWTILFWRGDWEEDKGPSPDDCAGCRRALDKRKAKADA